MVGKASAFSVSITDDIIEMGRWWLWGKWMVYSDDMVNLAGVNKVSNYLTTFGGEGWNFVHFAPTKAGLKNWDETSPNTYIESHEGAKWTKKDFTVDVSDRFDTEYMAVGIQSDVKPGQTGSTVQYQRKNWTLNWQKYTFAPQKSAANHKRPIYDFSRGAPKVAYTYFDGETSSILR